MQLILDSKKSVVLPDNRKKEEYRYNELKMKPIEQTGKTIGGIKYGKEIKDL